MQTCILKIVTIMTLLYISNVSCQYKMSPVELIDLVKKESRQNNVQGLKIHLTQRQEERTIQPAHEPGGIQNHNSNLLILPRQEETEDGNLLKNRKVWSRWGKWGECSVTCGAGAISRQRVCVAGRCAPGEREEQWRPCAMPPCAAHAHNETGDPSELQETE